ncbi:MAG: ABC transporter substrate-binding protein [Pseudomonadota bacterium]
MAQLPLPWRCRSVHFRFDDWVQEGEPMLRRQFLGATAAVLASSLAHGQAPRTARVAWTSVEPANPNSPFLAFFRKAMHDAGWTEGRNLALDQWWGGGSVEGLKKRIPDLAASRPDVIVGAGGPATRVLVDAQVTPPIVFAVSADVVLGKFVHSWAKPGVNRTGISFFSLELIPKRVQLIRELMPNATRLAIIGWPPHAGELLELEAAAKAADTLGFQHRYFGANNATELEAAFKGVKQWNGEVILAFAGALTSHSDRFAAFSLSEKIPTVSSWAVFAEKGNLVAFGPVLEECYARLAYFVDRIFKGAKPVDMPVELPTKVELVVNRGTAKALGIAIPQAVLIRADRFID